MAIVINGSGTVTGISVGGLPDDIVDAGTLADNAVGLAQMAGGTDGNIITYDTSGNPAVVATGSSGQVLTSAGADAVPTMAAAAAGGKILQVLSTPKTDTFSTASTTYVDITGLSIAITPVATSSKILVIANLNTGQSTTGNLSNFQLSGGNTANYVGDADGSRPRNTTGGMVTGTYDMKEFSITYLDSPATTGATTYKVQMKTAAGTSYINRNSTDPDATAGHRFASSITVMEIGA